MTMKRSVIKEKRRQKIKLSIKKRIKASYYSSVTGYYEKMEAKFHSIKLTGSYNYKQLSEKYGPFDFDIKYSKSNKKKIYANKYDKTVEGFKIILLTDPLVQGPPKTTIKITPPDTPTGNIKQAILLQRKYKAFLRGMNDSFLPLRLSSIEFAIDIYFKYPSEVESAFEVLKRNVFVPKKRTKPKIYPNSIRIGKHKIYMRGYDKNRGGKGWNKEDINRVRMEYTATGGELKKVGLNYLPDLLQFSKFYDINNDKWNFKNFIVIRSKKVPGELDPYPVDGSFQGEYIAAKDKVKNRSRRLTDSRGFDWFKYDLRDAMKFYDMKW